MSDKPSDIATRACNDPFVREICWEKARRDCPKCDRWAIDERGTDTLADIHGAVQEAATHVLAKRTPTAVWVWRVAATAVIGFSFVPLVKLGGLDPIWFVASGALQWAILRGDFDRDK